MAKGPDDPVTYKDLVSSVNRAVGQRLGDASGALIPKRFRPQFRIMTLSTSRGAQGAPAHWQSYLYEKLKPVFQDHYNLRFVGSNNGPPPLWNEGHAGFTLVGLNSNVATYLAANDPDLILILAGVNDCFTDGISGLDAAGRMNTLITTIMTQTRGQARIVVGTEPPVDSRYIFYTADKQAQLDSFNALMAVYFNAQSSTVRDVTLVDCHSGYVSLTDNADGVHQNASGAIKIADGFYNGIVLGGFSESA